MLNFGRVNINPKLDVPTQLTLHQIFRWHNLWSTTNPLSLDPIGELTLLVDTQQNGHFWDPKKTSKMTFGVQNAGIESSWKFNHNLDSTLPETNSSPLKIGRAPKGKNRIPTIHFQLLC